MSKLQKQIDKILENTKMKKIKILKMNRKNKNRKSKRKE